MGPLSPEWGAALAFPDARRIVMQGHNANAEAGDPFEVLRHELAHLALHEYIGELAPRWFDEGYASFAARELLRNEVLATNFALALRGMPSFDELDVLVSLRPCQTTANPCTAGCTRLRHSNKDRTNRVGEQEKIFYRHHHELTWSPNWKC